MTGRTELADEEDVHGRPQPLGDLEGDRHSPPRQGEDDDITAVGVAGQGLGQSPAGRPSVNEQFGHRHPLPSPLPLPVLRSRPRPLAA